jgi:acylphosphatase
MPVIHLKVVGRVQGVGFRWFVCERARELGIAGWVKNTRSGDVEVAASGEPSELALLETAVARGPSGASVAAVHRLAPPPDSTYPSPFRIEQ